MTPLASWVLAASVHVTDTTCAEPLALAASGSCTNKAGVRISRERMRLAHDVYAAVPWEDT